MRSLPQAVRAAQGRADNEDRKFCVYRQQHRKVTGRDRYQVRASGDAAPTSTATYATAVGPVYVAVPGHAPCPGDGVTPYYCEAPGCTEIPVPGQTGVRFTDGTILCNGCVARTQAVLS